MGLAETRMWHAIVFCKSTFAAQGASRRHAAGKHLATHSILNHRKVPVDFLHRSYCSEVDHGRFSLAVGLTGGPTVGLGAHTVQDLGPDSTSEAGSMQDLSERFDTHSCKKATPRKKIKK